MGSLNVVEMLFLKIYNLKYISLNLNSTLYRRIMSNPRVLKCKRLDNKGLD